MGRLVGELRWGVGKECGERWGNWGAGFGGMYGNLGQQKLPEIYEDNPNKGVYS